MEAEPKPSKDEAPQLNFIRDVAAEVDFFGSHQRVAKAIADVIATNDDLKVIGLLGRWGSGKSTVVQHVQRWLDKMGDDEVRTHVFCYDAWLHQSDPPRRAFLETLVDFLVDENLTTRHRWQLQLDILNRQVEDSETTSTPSLTPMGRVLLLSLALIPLGMHFIGRDWYDAMSIEGANWFDRIAFAAGWGCLAVPPILAVCTALFSNQESGTLLSLFVNRQVHKQVNRVTRSPDPTTIEFQKIFRAIIAGIGSKHRLIFVIDNLDRLHEAEAVEMWNTIRSFFLGSEHADRSRRGRGLPTVLLPIDKSAVELMYRKDHGPDLGKQLARAFMDKTFDLSFHVPPPVLSDWNLYVADQLTKVFGGAMEDDWAYQVGRLYEAQARDGHDITPRGINVVINELATLWLQWRDEIPFVTIAYFVVHRAKIEEDVFAAVSTPIVHIADLDPDWQRGLAALYYGAPRDKAIQVLIEPRLRAALEAWDPDEFKALALLPGFPETLQRLLDGARPGLPRFVAQASYLLSELAPDSAAWTKASWSTLRDLYVGGQPFQELDDADADALQALVDNCPRPLLPAFTLQTASVLSQSLEAVFAETPESRKVYVRLIGALVESAKANKLPAVSVRQGASPDTYLAILAHAADKADVARAINYIGPDQKLADSLVNVIGGSASASLDARFQALMHREPKVNWDGLIEACRTFLTDKSGANAATLGAANVLGSFWLTNEKAQKAVSSLSDDDILATRIRESNDPARSLRLARLTALAILNESTLEEPGGVSWEAVLKNIQSLPDQVRIALDRFDPSGHVHHLVAVSRRSPQALPLIRAILTRKVDLHAMGPLYVRDLLDQLPHYLKCIEDRLHDRFIAQLTGYDGFWSTLEARPFDDNTRRVLRRLAFRGGVAAATEKKARSQLKARLQASDKATWIAALHSGNEPLTVALDLARVWKGPVNAGRALFDALNDLLPALVTDKPDWAEHWFSAARLLTVASRKAVHRNLRDRLMSGTAVGLAELLDLAGETFLADADLEAYGDSAVRHIVSPMLTSTLGASWLAENRGAVRGWIKAAPGDARTFVKEQIKDQLKTADADQRRTMRALTAEWML